MLKRINIQKVSIATSVFLLANVISIDGINSIHIYKAIYSLRTRSKEKYFVLKSVIITFLENFLMILNAPMLTTDNIDFVKGLQFYHANDPVRSLEIFFYQVDNIFISPTTWGFRSQGYVMVPIKSLRRLAYCTLLWKDYDLRPCRIDDTETVPVGQCSAGFHAFSGILRFHLSRSCESGHKPSRSYLLWNI